MFFRKAEYRPLDSPSSDRDDEQQSHPTPSSPRPRSNLKYSINVALIIALFFSVATNFVLVLLHWPVKDFSPHLDHATKYAGLTKHVAVPYDLHDQYALARDQSNRDAVDKLWADLEIDNGVVALADTFVSEKELPEAMRFPWDSSRGVYFVNAYHNLHCLKKIYRALNEFDRGIQQSGAFPHVIHCLDALRQDVMCSADDTPRYAVMKRETPTGGGQYRQCRDWSELEKWTKEQTACWRYVNNTDLNADQWARFKYCPEGSEYLAKAREEYADAGPLLD